MSGISPTKKITMCKTRINMTDKIGLLVIGVCGDNASTLLANEIAREMGVTDQASTNLGSIIRTQLPAVASEVCIDFRNARGWDIVATPVGDSVRHSGLVPKVEAEVMAVLDNIEPWPAVFRPDYVSKTIAATASHYHAEQTVSFELAALMTQIQSFRAQHQYEHVIVLHQGSVEVAAEGFETHKQLHDAITANDRTISPSIVYALAAALTGCSVINGTPQVMLCPCIQHLLQDQQSLGVGRDLCTGQTFLKSVLLPALSASGKAVTNVISYNALSNNDGSALSEALPRQTKLDTKASMLAAHTVDTYPGVYQGRRLEDINHTVTIDYAQGLGNDKLSFDRYAASCYGGGTLEFSIQGRHEDSKLACGVLVDLLLVVGRCLQTKSTQVEADLLTSGWFKHSDHQMAFMNFHTTLINRMK